MVSGKAVAPSPPFVIDTSMFSSEDLQLFCESSKFIQKSREKRHSAGKSHLNSSIMKTREELFEVSEVDEKEYLRIATSACLDIDKNVKNLSADIDKLFQSFNENVSICENQGSMTRNSAGETYICNSSIHAGGASEIHSFDTPKSNFLRTPKSFSKPNITATTSTPNGLTASQIVREQLTLNKVKMIMDKEKSLKSHVEYPTVRSVKDRIEFFNKLSKKVSESRNMAAVAKPKIIKQPFVAHNPVKVGDMKSTPLEEVKQLPTSVKDRIKLFECITADSQPQDVKQTIMINNIPFKDSQLSKKEAIDEMLVLKPKSHSDSLVSKIRRYFEKSAREKSVLIPKHIGKVVPIKNSNPKFAANLKVFNKPEERNSRKVAEYTTKPPRVQTSNQEPQNNDVTNLPKSYDPFVESGKSLKKLGDIVSTIRNIREQGMTDLSRDLFEMFKQSLHAASARLAETKENHQSGITNNRNLPLKANELQERIGNPPVDSPGKKVAKVKPNLPNLSTFPRILKAIPKCKDDVGSAQSRNMQTSKKHNLFTNYDILNGTDLTYEKFVNALERHGNCKT